MLFLSISRHPCIFPGCKIPKCSITTTSLSVGKYLASLQKEGSNIEKSLNMVREKLNVMCITEVLQSCALEKPLAGLRFFVWAGLQPDYRHSSYMYGKACKVFKIKQKPLVVMQLIEAYTDENCLVNVKMFKIILNLCKESENVDLCLLVLRKMKELNFRPDTTMYNSVIKLFCEKGDMDFAEKLMREMGFIDLYPDMLTYVAMIKGFCDVGRLEDACRLFKFMKQHACSPNLVIYSALLDGICKTGRSEKALEFLSEMEKQGGYRKPNSVTYTSVIQNFCEQGRSMEAVKILDRMSDCGCAPNQTTVAILIKGLLMEGHIGEAYNLIDKIVIVGWVSASKCYSSLVVELWRLQRHKEAEKVFRMMLANALSPDSLASSILIRGLSMQGRVLDGYQLYNDLDTLGFVSSIDSDIYSILLSGLCQNSYLVEAVELARLMVKRQIQLKAGHMQNIVEYLKNNGEIELVSHFTSAVY